MSADATERAGYLACIVAAVILAALRLWWLAAIALGCLGLIYMGFKDLGNYDDL